MFAAKMRDLSTVPIVLMQNTTARVWRGTFNSMQYGIPILNDVAKNWLEQVSISLFLVSDDLRVIWANASGRSLMKQLGLRLDSFGAIRGNTREVESAVQNSRRLLLHTIAGRASWKNGTTMLSLADYPKGQIQLYSLSINGMSLIGCAVTTAGSEAKDLSELLTEYGLTSTEKKVVRMLTRGATASEIARTNGSSLLTIRTHIKRIYAKMGVHSREKMFARLSVDGTGPGMGGP